MRHPGRELFQSHSPVFLPTSPVFLPTSLYPSDHPRCGKFREPLGLGKGLDKGTAGGSEEGLQQPLSGAPSLGLPLWDGLGCTFSALSTCSVVNGAVSPATGRARGAHLVLAPVVREETAGLAQERRGSTSTRRSLAQQAGRCQVPTQLARCPLKPRTHHVIPLLKTSP